MAKKKKLKTSTLSIKIPLIIVVIISLLGFGLYKFIATSPAIFQIGSGAPSSADVVIAGAGSGGISAAIQAARQGARVVLIEETDYVGGQTTAAGVTSMDGNYNWRHGLYQEFSDQVIAYYKARNKSVGTCYWNKDTICFEPHVGRDIFLQMIANEPNITLLTRTTLTSVNKDSNKIVSVTTSGGTTITTPTLIDATEYGDVIMLTEPEYRLGNGTNQKPSPAACIQDITYLGVLKLYPQGVPNELKITTPPPGYTDEVKSIFRSIITKTGATQFSGSYPVNWAVHNSYRGMPDSTNPSNYDVFSPNITKTGLNWANDYPRTTTLSTRYLTDRSYRQTINCEAKLRTLQFVYYVQTELGQSNWSISTDEGYNTPYNSIDNSCPNIPSELKALEHNLPVMPYVRESIRGIGLTTLTAKDIRRTGNPPLAQKNQPTSIAIGDYPTDLHGCKADNQLESQFESSSDNSGEGAFQVPLESLISKNTQGLIFAEKNLSQTRLANGATRLQPITMLTGQAAGSLAAISAKSQTSPASVPTWQVQSQLASANSVLFPFSDVKPGLTGFASIQTLVGRGVLSGQSRTVFSSQTTLTREQAAIALLKAKYGNSYTPPSPGTRLFDDVPTNHPSYPWIQAFANDKITAGCQARRYCPTQQVTRAQFSIFLLKSLWGSSYLPPDAQGIFSDVPKTNFASRWVEDLKNKGITSGCGGSKYCPDLPLTRAQAAIMIDKALSQK